MRIALLVAFLGVCGIALAQPQLPTDTPQRAVEAASEADAQKREEDLAIQRAQLTFNERLTWITGFQAVLAAFALFISWRAWMNMASQTGHMEGQLAATEAAAKAATANLRLAFQPFVSIHPSSFHRIEGTEQEPVDFVLKLHAINVTSTPARVERIETNHRIQGVPGFQFDSQVGFTISPNGDHELFEIHVELSRQQVATYEQKELMIETVVIVQMRHPIDGLFWHTHNMMVRCPAGGQPEIFSRSDHEGRPEDRREQ